MATAMLAMRRRRAQVLPRELFGEPAWDLLLELFIADAAGHRLTGRDVGIRSAIPPSVLSRWLKQLTRTGHIVGDGSGNLDDPLTLSGTALAALEHLMLEAYEHSELPA